MHEQILVHSPQCDTQLTDDFVVSQRKSSLAVSETCQVLDQAMSQQWDGYRLGIFVICFYYLKSLGH